MKIKECKVNHLNKPVGYEMNSLVFSYKIDNAKGRYQKEARITISRNSNMTDLVYDTGWKSDIDSFGYEIEMELEPRTRYHWDVTVRTDCGEEAVSEVQYFETGKIEEEWHGQWITCDGQEERHPIFQREITLKKTLMKARLYIAGLGLYETFIDDRRVSDEYLTPYCNAYDKWIQYQTYDITPDLQEKRKAMIEVMLGNGWYKGRFGFDRKMNTKGYYGDSWKLIGEIHLEYEDGTKEVIGTDEKWNVRRSTIIFSNIYDGEWQDDTLSGVPAESVVIDEWKAPKLTARYSVPVKIHEELSVQEIIHTPAGETVLDMGQNFAGIFCLRVQEPAGTVIHLQFGEVLQEGDFYRENLRTAKAEYIYTTDGKERVIKPHFTFYGYRYVKVEGIKDIKKEDFTGLALYSDIAPVGVLQTGNEKVNRLIENAKWSQKGNFIDVPTDCPQRDERAGWTGDAQVFTATASYLTDSFAFYRKYLYDIKNEQSSHGGMVPKLVPTFGNQGTSSAWGDAICIIPWILYQFYGDKTILRETYESMTSWLSYIEAKDGNDHGWRREFHFGDWLALDHPSGKPDESEGGTDKGYIADCYYLNSLNITSKTAAVLGKETESVKYRKRANELLEEIKKEYFTPNGRLAVTTQTGYALASYFGVAPNRQVNTQLLKESLQVRGNRQQTGFVGTPILLNALSEVGLDQLAYDILLNEDYPGWLYAVNLGATTIWERWNSMNSDGTVSSTGMNSFNHYAYGTVVEWLWRYGAGINPSEEEPGFREVILTPKFNYEMGTLTASYHSVAGTYRTSWRVIDKEQVEYAVSIPFGCRAKLSLPFIGEETLTDKSNPLFADVREGICYLKKGEYRIRYHLTQPLAETLTADMPVKKILENKKAVALLSKIMPSIVNLPVSMKELPLTRLIDRYAANQEAAEDKQLQLNKMLRDI